MVSAENIRTIIRVVGMTDKDFAYNNKEYFSDDKTVTLETKPLREVPKGGVFIYETHGAYQVYWKRNRITEADIPIYDAYRSYLIYSTRTGKTNFGMNNYIEGKVQVAYMGVILKGEI